MKKLTMLGAAFGLALTCGCAGLAQKTRSRSIRRWKTIGSRPSSNPSRRLSPTLDVVWVRDFHRRYHRPLPGRRRTTRAPIW